MKQHLTCMNILKNIITDEDETIEFRQLAFNALNRHPFRMDELIFYLNLCTNIDVPIFIQKIAFVRCATTDLMGELRLPDKYEEEYDVFTKLLFGAIENYATTLENSNETLNLLIFICSQFEHLDLYSKEVYRILYSMLEFDYGLSAKHIKKITSILVNLSANSFCLTQLIPKLIEQLYFNTETESLDLVTYAIVDHYYDSIEDTRKSSYNDVKQVYLKYFYWYLKSRSDYLDSASISIISKRIYHTIERIDESIPNHEYFFKQVTNNFTTRKVKLLLFVMAEYIYIGLTVPDLDKLLIEIKSSIRSVPIETRSLLIGLVSLIDFEKSLELLQYCPYIPETEFLDPYSDMIQYGILKIADHLFDNPTIPRKDIRFFTNGRENPFLASMFKRLSAKNDIAYSDQ